MKQRLLENEHEFYQLLDQWQKSSDQLPAFGIGLLKRVETCTKVYLLFEDMAFRNNRQEPYSYMNPIVKNEIEDIKILSKLFEKNSHLSRKKGDHIKNTVDLRNKDLFQGLWNKYDEEEYEHSVKLMVNRFKRNGLNFKNKNCLDIGCGGGRVCVAMARLGAKSVIGIDYGKDNIAFANRIKNKQGIKNIKYRKGNTYKLPFEDNTFDVAVSNGVLHHLEKPGKALREVYRVLAPGGWLWLYVVGRGGMINAICEATKMIMREVDSQNVLDIFISSGLSQHKIYTLMDNFYATYFYYNYRDLNSLLRKTGFKNIRRLIKGNTTDYNVSRIRSEPYVKEKFGEGEIRLIAHK